MRLTKTTRVLKRRSTLPKGRNPQPPHFKKFTPLGLFAACIIGSGLLLTTTVQAEEECTINLKDNTHTCQNIAAIQQQSLENNQAVFKIDFNPALYAHTKAILVLKETHAEKRESSETISDMQY